MLTKMKITRCKNGNKDPVPSENEEKKTDTTNNCRSQSNRVDSVKFENGSILYTIHMINTKSF